MRKRQRIVLFSTLYWADESKVSRDLVMRLEEHIQDEVVTPDLLLDKCFLIYSEPGFKGYSDDNRKYEAVKELQRAFFFAVSHTNIMVDKAKKMKNILHGWKISRGHHRNKENKQ